MCLGHASEIHYSADSGALSANVSLRRRPGLLFLMLPNVVIIIAAVSISFR